MVNLWTGAKIATSLDEGATIGTGNVAFRRLEKANLPQHGSPEEGFRERSPKLRYLIAKNGTRRDVSDLMFGTLSHESVKDGLVGGLAKTASVAHFLVMLKSRAQSFRAVVEGIAEGFVKALQCITLSHEDLDQCQTHAHIFSRPDIGLLFRKLSSMLEGEWPQRWVCKTWPCYDKDSTPRLTRTAEECTKRYIYLPKGTSFIHVKR